MKLKEQIKKYKELNDADLLKELKNAKKELALLSLKAKVGKLADISSVKKMKKNVARINTIMSEKFYGAENE